jgi:hypothetical protein
MSHCSWIAGYRHPGDRERLQELARFWGAAADLPHKALSSGAQRSWRAGEDGVWQFANCPLGNQAPPQLEIETNNLEAEAARLEERGARRIGHLRQLMWLLEAPGGERLRVLVANRLPMANDATHWV